MADRTGIEWTDATWNPVTGCTKVSPGCDNCYAETFTERFRGTPGHYFEGGFNVQLRPHLLDLPLRWRRPRMVFVNSMADLFHDDVPDEYIARVFAVMALAYPHSFQVLTKRPGRMRSLLSSARFVDLFDTAWCSAPDWGVRYPDPEYAPAAGSRHLADGPLANVWLGVSVESQKWADVRVPVLLDTPAAVRFLSCEPLLGPVDMTPCSCRAGTTSGCARHDFGGLTDVQRGARSLHFPAVDWVIVGGESGAHARPMHPDWARQLRDQCTAAGVPFLFKQWGEHAEVPEGTPGAFGFTDRGMYSTVITYGQGGGTRPGGTPMARVGKKRAGRELDGRTWDQYPTAVHA